MQSIYVEMFCEKANPVKEQNKGHCDGNEMKDQLTEGKYSNTDFLEDRMPAYKSVWFLSPTPSEPKLND